MNYQLTYTTFTDNNIPVNHREAKIRAYFAVLTKPLQSLRDLFFNYVVNSNNSYFDLSAIVGFELGSAFSIDTVVYNFWIDSGGVIQGDMALYICIKDTTGSETCDNTEYWLKVNDSLLGLSSYNLINAQTILFEWALNTIMYNNTISFQFRQPSNVTRSDIYIENLPSTNPFDVGFEDDESSYIVFSDAEAINYVYAENIANEPYNYVIYIPTAFNDAIVAGGQTKESFMANVVNKFNLSGISYKIEIY